MAHNETATVVAIDVSSFVCHFIKTQNVALVCIAGGIGDGYGYSAAAFIDFKVSKILKYWCVVDAINCY